jgi:hypothetical protein
MCSYETSNFSKRILFQIISNNNNNNNNITLSMYRGMRQNRLMSSVRNYFQNKQE